ncbi:MAG: phosphocarrier protein HPr [Gammaproteobacteria bacterium CG22_combo_CG10-13_8_21_14_all_40_8]|nr:MAG: phosphocarrier protein HPr [Gammaproteobacteria bacterium CG22_combo_CG10-13_8_21_14_all_40_8]
MKNTYSSKLTICNPKGLHARSSAKFVNCATNFNCKVEVSYLDKKADGTSLIQLMLLSPPAGETIHVFTTGLEAKQALESLTALVNNGFDELENNT